MTPEKYRLTPEERELRKQICTQLISDWLGRPLVWGLFDCAQMARDLAIRLGKPDPMADWVKYKTKGAARKSLKAMGFDSFGDALLSKLEPLPSIGYVMEGDLITVKSNDLKMDAIAIRCDQQNYIMLVQAEGEEVANVKKFPVSDAWDNDQYILKGFRFK